MVVEAMPMPEPMDRLLRGSRMGELADGFEIRRGFYPTVAGGPVVLNRTLSHGDNNENMPLSGSGSAQRRYRSRKSPLPTWYPRTPLRDITALVKAMERRRLRLQAARLRPSNQSIEASSAFALPPIPLGQEVIASEQTPARQEVAPTEVSEMSVTPSAPDCSPQTASSGPTKPMSEESSKSTEPDKKVWSSFDGIEKVVKEFEKLVMENLKRNGKETTKKTPKRSTLMSMR